MKNKITFWFKQLLPLKYYSKYRVQNASELAIWTQWFGKPFNIKRFTIKGEKPTPLGVGWIA